MQRRKIVAMPFGYITRLINRFLGLVSHAGRGECPITVSPSDVVSPSRPAIADFEDLEDGGPGSGELIGKYSK